MILQVARDFLREKGLKSFADIIAKLKDDPKFRKDIITAIIKGSRGKLTKEELQTVLGVEVDEIQVEEIEKGEDEVWEGLKKQSERSDKIQVHLLKENAILMNQR